MESYDDYILEICLLMINMILLYYLNQSSVAKYYQQSGDTIDLIPTVSSLLGVPFSVFAAYFICRFGLKHGLYVGSTFTGIGKPVLQIYLM